MKSKIIIVIGSLISILLIVESYIYFIKNFSVPGLIPFTLAALMLFLIYSTHQQFSKGKIDEQSMKTTVIIAFISCVMNLITAISQLYKLL